jgi:hypothetical protein
MKGLLLALIFFMTFNVKSQTLSPSSINCSGETFKSNTIRYTHTLGDIYVPAVSINNTTLKSGIVANINKLTLVLDNQNQINSLSIYPNPVQNGFRLKQIETIENIASIAIFDNSGKQIYITNSINEEIIISNFSNGIYIVAIFDTQNNIISTFKIVKL